MTDLETNGAATAEATRTEPVFVPPTDIVETTSAVQMMLDMPGADPDSLDVTLDNRVLRISARSASSAPEGYSLLHAEYRDGNYERSFRVSEPIDSGGNRGGIQGWRACPHTTEIGAIARRQDQRQSRVRALR